jgi:hypothetical protein
MNKFSALILATALCLPFVSYTQEFSSEEKNLIGQIKRLMNDDELADVVEAESSFEESRFIKDQADMQDFDLEKAFAKGSTPKAEKKAVNVKVQRSDAARSMERGFVLMQGAFESRLSKSRWEFDDDKESAKSFQENSALKLEEANTKTEEYKYFGAKDFASFKYDDLKESIDGAEELYMQSIRYQFDAYRLLLDQQNKKQRIADDNFSWGLAQRDNSIESYQAYLGKQPNGLYASQANDAIASLRSGETPEISTPAEIAAVPDESTAAVPVPVSSIVSSPAKNAGAIANEIIEKPVQIEEDIAEEPAAAPIRNAEPAVAQAVPVKQNIAEAAARQEKPAAKDPVPAAASISTPGLVYSVQFIAVRREMEKAEIAGFYSGELPVSVRLEDGLHKYSIGEFATFDEARAFRKSLEMQNFIVAIKDGTRIPLNEALRQR